MFNKMAIPSATLCGLVLGCANVASALSWPDESQEIEARDFVDRNGQHWVCDLFDGHESFVNLGREYYFEDTDQLDDSGNITGLFHSVTFDRGTLIAQGFQIRAVTRGAAYLRRAYVTDDGVDFPQFVGENVSLPMKVSGDGTHLYPGTFKDVDGQLLVGILDCTLHGTVKPEWAK